jgi:Cu2+-exporting ATPase
MFARADAFETLARVTHVVFDKTGTLTEGRVRLAGWQALDGTADEALRIAGALEARSEHPLARALVDAAGSDTTMAVADLRQCTGEGVAATVAGTPMRLGSLAFVAALAGPMPAAAQAFARTRDHTDTLVALGAADRWIAVFACADTLRAGAGALIADLGRLGITPLLLSGDRAETVSALAATLAIDDARGGLSPAAKADAITDLQRKGAVVAMVGDGVNDAPALALAQVSVSLGSATPLAQRTADVVVLPDRLELIADALTEARRTLRIIRQNLSWAALYNAIAIPAAALGFVTPLAAAAGMSLSSLLVVGNAMRLARSARRRDVAALPAPDAAPTRALRDDGDPGLAGAAVGRAGAADRRHLLVERPQRPVRRSGRTRPPNPGG